MNVNRSQSALLPCGYVCLCRRPQILLLLSFVVSAIINMPRVGMTNESAPVPPIIVTTADEPTLVERLCAEYERIETITCEIRKTTVGGGRTVRMLSRVFYKKPDHIHVDNVAPAKRRIIADGKKFYYHEQGVSRGFSRPIAELTEEWLVSLRNIPGTPMEHLLRLKGTPETPLPATEEFPLRRGYQTEKLFVVLSCDNDGKLVRIEFFKSPEMKEKTAQYDYSVFQKAVDNCWISCLQKAVVFLPGDEDVTETRRIDNLEVNKPIADMMFRVDIFFKDVDFVDEFKDTYALPQ